MVVGEGWGGVELGKDGEWRPKLGRGKVRGSKLGVVPKLGSD